MEKRLSLDVESPDQVATVLRAAAQAYYESQGELQAAWQDQQAGHDWSIIARELERAADRIDGKI